MKVNCYQQFFQSISGPNCTLDCGTCRVQRQYHVNI